MTLYTRHGDDGSTSLYGGRRVPKDDVRVSAYGQVDEANAAIGWAAGACREDDMLRMLQQIQSDLLNLGAELAAPATPPPRVTIRDDDVRRIERWIDEATAELEPLTGFILPGGVEMAGRLHVARTVCRRAERAMVRLARQQGIDGAALAYVNRLSDLLFVLARRANARAGVPDIQWDPTGRS